MTKPAAHSRPDLTVTNLNPEQLLQAALAAGLPVAAWQLPGQKVLHVCLALEPDSELPLDLSLETHEPGFVFHPFEKNKAAQAFYIKADVFFSSDTPGITLSAGLLHDQDKKNRLEKLLNFVPEKPAAWHAGPNHQVVTANRDQFINLVKKGVAAIRSGEMDKVVLSRIKQVVLPENFNLFAGFAALTEKYPAAFVSVVSVPGAGTWLGASPEILVQVDKNRVFRTVALAGTQRLTAGSSPKTAVWRQKEIEEQSMVERYILNCFKKIRLRDYEEAGPRTIVAGNLMHLRTDFSVLPEVAAEHPALATEMLLLLHPTSAVCGMPKTPALNFIKANEGYNRMHYSGYLGPVNLAGETSLFVNLRCMQLGQANAILYAGAGITAESDPEKEWTETELKMETIWSVIGNNEMA